MDCYHYMIGSDGISHNKLLHAKNIKTLGQPWRLLRDCIPDRRGTPLEAFMWGEYLEKVYKYLKLLPPEQSYVLIRFYGLSGDIPQLQIDIARTVGRSPTWVHFRLKEAEHKLLEYVNEN